MLASASTAIIIGFNVRPSTPATALAESEGVDMRTYRVIYKVIEDMNAALVGMLKPEVVEDVVGSAEVRQTFKASQARHHRRLHGHARQDPAQRRGSGCCATAWSSTRARSRSLKRFSEDAREVAEGFECGILLDGFNDLKEGDVLEAFETREVARGV